MILTDREIEIAIEQNLIEISPKPKENQYSSTSLDLTLGKSFREFKDQSGGIKVALDPSSEDYVYANVIKQISETKTIDLNEGYKLEPSKLILAWTTENIKLITHTKIAARVEGKSSLARIGLAVHITAPTIHSGFSGNIQLEIVNHGKLPIILRQGMRVCQLIFEQTTGTPVTGYKGRFQDQTFDK